MRPSESPTTLLSTTDVRHALPRKEIDPWSHRVRRSRTRGYDAGMPTKVLLAAPRGYCAGVEQAVEAVEGALEAHGAPVYVRKQIVHNAHVVRDLESKGAVFVEEETQVPEREVVV